MTLPTLTCRIAFDSDPFDYPPSWTDVSADLISYSFKRGRQHQLDRFEAGTCTIILKNIHNNYWPNNTDGDYSPNVKIGKRVNIRATYGGNTYDRYTGFIDRILPMWFSQDGLMTPGVSISCSDLLSMIAKKRLNDGTGYSQELSGTRVGNVLDDIGWNATERDIDTGKENIIASGAITNVNAMEHLFLVQDSELGNIFIMGDGKVKFEERGGRANTSLATFGDSEIPIYDPKFPMDDDLVRNEIRLTRQGGTEQVYTDTTSITNYGPRTFSKTGLLLTSDITAFMYCLYYLARYHEAYHRIKSITLKPQHDPADCYPKALGYEIGSCITVTLARAFIDNDYFIEGIEESFDYRKGEFVTKWQLSDAAQYYYTPDATDIYLRPSAAGDVTSISTQFPNSTAHWDKVCEVTADDDSTYVEGAIDATQYDLYALPDQAFTGTINSVTVYARCRASTGTNSAAQPVTKTHAVEYRPGTTAFLDANWHNLSAVYNTNPNTGDAWTWTEINALQVGVELVGSAPAWNSKPRCTQVYVKVNFTPSW